MVGKDRGVIAARPVTDDRGGAELAGLILGADYAVTVSGPRGRVNSHSLR